MLGTMIFVPANYVVVVVGYCRCAAALVAGSVRRSHSRQPFSLLTNSFDRRAIEWLRERYRYWQSAGVNPMKTSSLKLVSSKHGRGGFPISVFPPPPG